MGGPFLLGLIIFFYNDVADDGDDDDHHHDKDDDDNDDHNINIVKCKKSFKKKVYSCGVCG